MSVRLSPTIAAIGLVSMAAAQRSAEIEPNDNATQAQHIEFGIQLDASLATTADVDWYSFSLAEPQQVHLRIHPAPGVGGGSRDTLVAIYDRTGLERLAWNDRAGSQHSDCGVTLPTGDYRCLVALKPNGSPSDYQLEFTTLPPRVINVHEGPEPNDNPALGGSPTRLQLGDTIDGEISTHGDVDWFAFELQRPGIVQVLCLDDGGVPQLDNTQLQFWRESSPGVWSSFGVPSFVRTSHRALDLAHTTNLPAGNFLQPGSYAIQVDAKTSTPVGTAPWDYRKVGKYALRTALIELPGRGPVREGDEPNEAAANATPLTLGDDALGHIDGRGDTDWFRIEVGAATTIGATAEGIGNTPLPVTSVRLWDTAGRSLASGTGTAVAHGKLVHTVPKPGVYFLEVKGRLFQDTGSYVLHTGSSQPLDLERPAGENPAARAEPAEASVRQLQPPTATGTTGTAVDRSY
jgi:hypothetical protein